MIKSCAVALFVAIAAPAMAEGSAPAVVADAATVAPLPVDPARLALGHAIVARIMPPGQLREMMNATMGPLTNKILDQMKTMPLGRMLEAFGMPPEQARKVTMDKAMQVAAILDPAYQRREELSMKVLMDGIIDITASVEPDMREALSSAYARNFDLAQLSDINRFFGTPSGAAYARRATLLASDPGVRDAAAKMMPKMIEAMPDLIKKGEAATASLPRPRDPKTLTDAERARIAQLLGIDPAELNRKPAGGAKS